MIVDLNLLSNLHVKESLIEVVCGVIEERSRRKVVVAMRQSIELVNHKAICLRRAAGSPPCGDGVWTSKNAEVNGRQQSACIEERLETWTEGFA